MKKIVHYCVIGLASMLVGHAHSQNNDVLEINNAKNRFLGCSNPLYPKIAKNLLPTKISASKMDVQSNGRIFLRDQVEIPITNGSMKALSANYDSNGKRIDEITQGNIYYLDSYFKFESGSLNETSKDFSFIEGNTYLAERNLLVNYKSLSGELGSSLIFKDANLTSCLDTSDGWQISAKTIAINEKSKRGYIKNLSLKVKDNTLLKLPYLPFAVSTERLNGFLEPDIGITSDGLDIYLPYFFVLSERSDITIAPRALKKRGLGLETNYRYLTSASADNYLDLMFFSGDKEAKKNYAVDDSRWAFKWSDLRKFKNFVGKINWSKSSDPMVLLDLPSNLTNIATQRDHYLPQSIEVSGHIKNFYISIARQGYQSLNPFLTNGFIKKPELNLSYLASGGPLTFIGKIQYSDFNLEHSINNLLIPSSNFKEGSRSIAEIELSSKSNIGVVNFGMHGTLVSKKYNLANASSSQNSKSIPSFGIEASTTLRRILPSRLSLITPSLSYEKTSYEDQTLDPIFDLHIKNSNYLHSPKQALFFGKDRIADQEYFLAKIKWRARFQDKQTILFQLSKKHEKEASKVFNQILGINLDADRQSGVKAQWDSPNLNAFMEANYSDKRNELNFANTSFTLNLQETQLSFSRKFRRQVPLLGPSNKLDYGEVTLDQTLVGGYKILAGISKDLATQKNLASYLGIGFENCCFAFKLFASDKRLSKYDFTNGAAPYANNAAWENMISVENKSRINFEFELKGITGSKTQLNKFFSNAFANF